MTLEALGNYAHSSGFSLSNSQPFDNFMYRIYSHSSFNGYEATNLISSVWDTLKFSRDHL